MLILAADTSAPTTSLAIVRDGDVLDLYDETHAHPPSDAAFVLLERMLARTKLSPADFDAFAACTGPGSFTGLRIGLGMAKTMAWSCGVPVVGLDALEVAAHRTGDDVTGPFTMAVAGFKKTVFHGRFGRTGDGRIERLSDLDWVDGSENLASRVPEGDTLCVTAELAARGGLDGATLVTDGDPAAVIIARVARQRIEAGETTPFEKVQPLYLKPFSIGKKASTMKDMR